MFIKKCKFVRLRYYQGIRLSAEKNKKSTKHKRNV